jgi:hypothetical protein
MVPDMICAHQACGLPSSFSGQQLDSVVVTKRNSKPSFHVTFCFFLTAEIWLYKKQFLISWLGFKFLFWM